MLRSRDLARACARLEVEKIGTSCEMVCETGLPAVPLLRPLLNMLMLARGVVPIHAAAFRYRERGVLVTGWSYGSKTGSLLAFMARGAKFVGDEWIYVSPADDRMYGLPDQLEARSWYLRELPQVRRHVGLADRVRTKVAAGAASLLGPLAAGAERRNTLTSKLVRQIHQKLHDQQSIHMRPRTLFGGDCILESPLDIVIVAVSHEAEEILVRPDSIEQAVARMAASFLAEQASLTSLYQKYLFAFPDRRNPLLDQVELIYRKHLLEGLAGKRAYTMLHPYPVTIAALQEAIEPLFSEGILTPSAGLNPRLSPSNG